MCEQHAKVRRKQADEHRGNATQRGYGYRWQQTSKGYLRSHPQCQCNECQKDPIQAPAAEVVDHIIPHRVDEALKSGDPSRIAKSWALFWDYNNWQAMTKACHDRKTAAEDGGFTGRPGAG
ncbi:MAG TPA: HNH endonuclease [Methylophilaceae bacterium]|nr:HNH endonuclease [Methylophilaceae bacterium]